MKCEHEVKIKELKEDHYITVCIKCGEEKRVGKPKSNYAVFNNMKIKVKK